MDRAFEALLHKLEAQPHNLVLRLAVVRRAVASNLDSRALELVLELDPDLEMTPDDRALISGVFNSAGLEEDAERWGPDSSRRSSEPEPALNAPVMPNEGSEQLAPVPAVPPRTLRVVGGTADDGASATLPEQAEAALTFTDVGGLDDVKRDIERRIIAPFKQSGLLARFKKRRGGGVLLYGPPGCGKTLIARATAGECGFGFTSVSISDLLDSHWGETEKRLTQLFNKARHSAPAILFFDEIDAIGSKRTSASATHHAQLVSHFLAELDGINASNDGVLVLAATNIPWSMDGAFLRPGRFDRMFFVPPPDKAAREAILALEIGARPATPGLRLDRIANMTSGLSGADLSLVVEDAADMAIDATLARGNEVPIDQSMLENSAKGVRSSVTDWLTTARNHATYANESGRYDDILAFLKAHGRG